MTQTDNLVASLQVRIERAAACFGVLNKLEPPDGYYVPPNGWANTGAIAALVTTLGEAGVLDVQKYLVQTLMNQAEILENSVRAAAEDYRQKTGVSVPLGPSSRPQG